MYCGLVYVSLLPSDLDVIEVLARRAHEPWYADAVTALYAEPAQFAQPATDGFYASFDPDPALPGRLAALTAPVLLVAGEYDIWPTCAAVRRLVGLLSHADLAVLPQAGHFPWLDDPASFAATVREFLAPLGGTWSR